MLRGLLLTLVRRRGRLLFTLLLPAVMASGPSLSATDDIATRSSSIGRGIVVGEHVYFVAYETADGATLWRTDGTKRGTRMVRDIRPDDGPRDYFRDWYPFEPKTALGDRLLLVVDDGVHGTELWRSDGRARGTRLVKDIRPGRRGASPYVLGVIGDRAILLADDGVHGRELWVSDATAPGTRLLKDIRPGKPGVDIAATWPGSDRFWIVLDDGVHGKELWVTDGTSAGTRLVRDIRPGPKSAGIWEFAGLLAADDILYFYADDGVHGEELWRSDGTEAGTELLKDIDPGADATQHQLCAIADDADDFLIAMSYDIWTSDGTTDGTKLGTGEAQGAPSSMDLEYCTSAGDEQGVYLTGPYDDAPGYGLWWSDGSAEGTTEVARFESADPPEIQGAPTIHGQLVFVANDRVHGWEPWVSDGTPSGTRMLLDIRVGPRSSSPLRFAPSVLMEVDGLVYWAADDGINGMELWVTDGSPSGTHMVRDINPNGGSGPSAVATSGSDLYFTADDGRHGRELWRTDGTVDGTRMLRDINRRAQQ